MSRGTWGKIIAGFVAGALFGVISAVQIVPRAKTRTELISQGSQRVSNSPGAAPSVLPSGVISTGPGVTNVLGVGPVPQGVLCAPGHNGGATDVGVTATTINLATTVVRSGIGAAFLGDVQFAMEAVKNKVNAAGGICGRRLVIRYVDDGWDPTRGAQYLGNFLNRGSGIFAIPVAPSSEGLNIVINHGDVDRAAVPVIGTDGMLINQYTDPWVWPVAVSTASTARIMAKHAHDMGVKNFSIVFDKNYKFGQEAAAAFNNEVKRLTGNNVPGFDPNNGCNKGTSYCGVVAGQSTYGTEVQNFQPRAGALVAMFLEPATALQWMATTGAPTASSSSGYHVWGAQPLFTRDFAVNCQAACDGMWVWTGYKPPIENYANDPAVRTFQSDLAKTNPQADYYNAFAEGGYEGMELLVRALQQVGPYLTRARLRAVLDSMQFSSGLTLQSPIGWRAGNHFSNWTMQGFAIQYKGTFGGWRGQDMVRDPSPTLGKG